MRRIGYFLAGLTLGSKLQFLAFSIYLGYVFYAIDMNPALRWFGVPLWQVTGPLILCTIVFGRVLLPLMMMHPERAQRVLSWFGLITFVVSYFRVHQWWGRLMITHVVLTLALWLDFSCWFWFISEIQRRLSLLSAAGIDMTSSQFDEDEESER